MQAVYTDETSMPVRTKCLSFSLFAALLVTFSVCDYPTSWVKLRVDIRTLLAIAYLVVSVNCMHGYIST